MGTDARPVDLMPVVAHMSISLGAADWHEDPLLVLTLLP